MMKNLVLLGAMGLVAMAGCKREPTGERERPGTTTVTGGNVAAVQNQTGIDRIVTARCAREAACNNLGPDKRYADQNACSRQLHADMRDDLGAKECPGGIDAKELDECLAEIKNQDCNNPLDAISRLAACRTSDLCKSTTAPNR